MQTGVQLAPWCVPPMGWWHCARRASSIWIDVQQPKVKALPVNRTVIFGPNGPHFLSVPLVGGRNSGVPFDALRIDDRTAWQRQWLGALRAAYGKSPYFGLFFPEFSDILAESHSQFSALSLDIRNWMQHRFFLTDLSFSLGPESNFTDERRQDWEKVAVPFQTPETPFFSRTNTDVLPGPWEWLFYQPEVWLEADGD